MKADATNAVLVAGNLYAEDLSGGCQNDKARGVNLCPVKATAAKDDFDWVLPERARQSSTFSEPASEPRAQAFVSKISEPEPGPSAPATPHHHVQLAPQLAVRQLPTLARNPRFRRSCFFEATLRAGATDWSLYNHMLLPCRYDWYDNPIEEYEHLKSHVCIWDVAAERQVELVGPDSVTLIEMLTPRPMGDMKVGQCRYAIITDDEGMVLNDPVVSRIGEDKFWLSGADGDLILWAKGLAVGRGLHVKVTEASVSPVAVQGPKSTALIADLLGDDWIYDLKYFNFRQIELDGMPIACARSGWSPEVGYELYLQDESRGNELWDRLMEAGKRYNLRPGSPNLMRRIEGGMLNFGSDITPDHSILELGLPPSWIGAPDKCKKVDFIDKEALQRAHQEGGAKRRVVGIELCDKEACRALESVWDITVASQSQGDFGAVGKVTSIALSPSLDSWIGIATLANDVAEPGTNVCVNTPDGVRRAIVKKLPFLPREQLLPRPKVA
mmetsp:Transcript_77483/g.215333  ORF Transcript_77483/g.215333 Transcript_77483/m.215333 type:complete len:499 (+) Transcript_77483:64-1560(+)